MDVIVAARLSQKRGDGVTQEGHSDQDTDARDWSLDRGHNVVATIADYYSGSKAMWQRPNIKPWVTDPALMAKYQGIVAAKQDRLSREEFWDEIELRKWAEANGKTLFIVDRNMQWPPNADDYEDGVRRWNDGAQSAREEWVRTSKRYKRMQKGKRERGSLTGRRTYGLQIIKAVNDKGQPIKTLAPHDTESLIVREAADRYLDGETIDAIREDFMAREVPAPMFKGQPGKVWHAKTLAGLLRNPAIAGRRVDADGNTILKYEGIITWDEHNRIVARLDSRAHRKGISPGNVALLTSTLFDEEGHPMYRWPLWNGPGYYCRKCHVSVDLEKMDARVNAMLAKSDEPYMVMQAIVTDHQSKIDDLEADLSELAAKRPAGWLAKAAAIESDIDALKAKQGNEPKRVEWIPNGKTYGQMWENMTVAQRRDMLKDAGFRFIARKDGSWSAVVPEGWLEVKNP